MKLPDLKNRLDLVANFLNARPVRERLLLGVFFLVLLLVVDVFAWFMPITRTLTHAMPAMSALETQLEGLKSDKKNEVLIREKWENTQKQLADDEERLVGPEQIPTLLENLSKLAFDSGVKITSIQPAETTPLPEKPYFAVPIALHAVAGTHEIGSFIERLETGHISLKITDLKIASNPLNERGHWIEMRLETYRKK